MYNKKEELLQAAIWEVNLDETLTVGEDELETPVQIRTQNSSDDEGEDSIDQQIRISPIQPLILLQQVLANIAMATTTTTHTTTIPRAAPKGTTVSSSTDIATKFQKGMKQIRPPGGGAPGGSGGPEGGTPGGGPPGGGMPGGIPVAPLA